MSQLWQSKTMEAKRSNLEQSRYPAGRCASHQVSSLGWIELVSMTWSAELFGVLRGLSSDRFNDDSPNRGWRMHHSSGVTNTTKVSGPTGEALIDRSGESKRSAIKRVLCF